jgi:hypothetical protein
MRFVKNEFLTPQLSGLTTRTGFCNQRPVSVRQPADLTASEKLGGITNAAQPGLDNFCNPALRKLSLSKLSTGLWILLQNLHQYCRLT